jgi:Flp pilus assembly protein TadD
VALSKKDSAAAETVASRLEQREPESAGFHNQLAWTLATSDSPSKGILDIAEKSATRANDIAQGKDAAIMDTVARVQFMRGNKEQAIKTQQKAVDLMTDDGAKKEFTKTLDSYKSGKLPDAE